jgi:hypothetical protein
MSGQKNDLHFKSPRQAEQVDAPEPLWVMLKEVEVGL